MSFKDKVVIVTGASSGIGAATAIKFAAEGAKVTIVARNETKLKNVAEKCVKSGSKPLIIIADVTNDEDLLRIVDGTLKQFGKLDVLVNNAGISISCSILDDNALKLFDQTYATNLRSIVHLTNLAAPHLVETKGNIINISSIASLKPLTSTLFAYGTSKAGLDHFTKCVALDLAEKGVRVNAVNPGPVRTDIVENAGATGEYIDMAFDNMKKGTALNRISESDEIADLILFIASDKAKGITGGTYVTDNGFLLNGKMGL